MLRFTRSLREEKLFVSFNVRPKNTRAPHFTMNICYVRVYHNTWHCMNMLTKRVAKCFKFTLLRTMLHNIVVTNTKYS